MHSENQFNFFSFPTEKLIPKKLTKEEINVLPLYQFTGKITFVTSEEAMNEALQKLEKSSVVGFDTETKPSFRKGRSFTPSLLQIATHQEVILFHLRKVFLSQRLIAFLENQKIIKTGVAIKDDLIGLAKIKKFTPKGIIDLSVEAKKNGLFTLGLRGLAALFLGVRISKSEQCSNWGKDDLTQRQIIYAATDAFVSLAIYLQMQEKGLLPL